MSASSLFEPFTLRQITFKNRIFVSPMCQYSSPDGFATDWHLVHLGSRAVGQAALVFTEATAVNPEGRISPADLGIWKDAHIDKLAQIFRFIKEQGSVPGMQLAHAGRKASTAAPWLGGKPVTPEQGGWTPIFAPSAIAFDEGYQVPSELTREQIAGIVQDFRSAALRALNAGSRVLEIHAAHGYLLHSFLSPLSNRRSDEYGGSFENRSRALQEVITAVREVFPENLPLFLRISATDWAEGGWDLEQSIELARMVKPLGVDLIDCSSGGLLPRVKIPVGPGYQVRFAQEIKRQAGIATAAVGMITSAAQADQIVRTGQADAVIMAREFLRNPYFPALAQFELHQPEAWPAQYERARRGAR
jgi:2,4-dienoyl-CoA reductase-like NADH-dependent reductase (Old Yellow Enzyme family)